MYGITASWLLPDGGDIGLAATHTSDDIQQEIGDSCPSTLNPIASSVPHLDGLPTPDGSQFWELNGGDIDPRSGPHWVKTDPRRHPQSTPSPEKSSKRYSNGILKPKRSRLNKHQREMATDK